MLLKEVASERKRKTSGLERSVTAAELAAVAISRALRHRKTPYRQCFERHPTLRSPDY